MEAGAYESDAFGAVRRTIGPHGYLAYFPAPLPLEVDLKMATVRALANAESALGRLAGTGRLLPNPHLLVRPYMVREAVASARIEGTQTTIAEVYEAAAGGGVNPDVEEVLNYISALDRGMELLDDLPLSMRLLRDVHAVLLAGVRGRDRQPGHLRTTQNWIGAPTDTINDTAFVPPPPDALGECLTDLERFAHHQGEMPDLVQCALVHYQFETIHPFLDGNGRLGRLLIVLFLVVRARLPAPILYVSPYFEEHRDEYIATLQRVREKGEVDQWLRFFLGAIEHQALDAAARAEELVDLREHYRRLVTSRTRSQASAVVDMAFESPVLTAPIVEQGLNITRAGASNLLTQLEGLGVLRPLDPGPRSLRRWIATEVMNVVSKASSHGRPRVTIESDPRPVQAARVDGTR